MLVEIWHDGYRKFPDRDNKVIEVIRNLMAVLRDL